MLQARTRRRTRLRIVGYGLDEIKTRAVSNYFSSLIGSVESFFDKEKISLSRETKSKLRQFNQATTELALTAISS